MGIFTHPLTRLIKPRLIDRSAASPGGKGKETRKEKKKKEIKKGREKKKAMNKQTKGTRTDGGNSGFPPVCGCQSALYPPPAQQAKNNTAQAEGRPSGAEQHITSTAHWA